MAARGGLAGGNRSVGRSRGPFLDRGRGRRRLFRPAPEPLEDRILLASSLPAGSLDPSFNSAGWVTAQVGTADAGGAGAVQSDGKIVLAGGVIGSGGVQTIALVRDLPNGQLDTSFGPAHTGIVALDPGLKIQAAQAIALVHDPGQPDDGDIVVAGTWSDPATTQTGVALARFQSDGSLDQGGFGTAGIVRDARAPGAQGRAIALQPDGQIVVGGIANTGTTAQPIDTPFVERFHSDGTPGTGFGPPSPGFPTGQPALYFFVGVNTTWGGMALDDSGNLVVAGLEQTSIRPVIGLARVKSDGTLDPSFGASGSVTTDLGSGAVVESVDGVAIDPSRGIVVAGTVAATAATAEDFLVARYNFQGDLDPAFNQGAVEFIDFQRAGLSFQQGQSNADFARAIAVQPDGKVVVAGDTAVPAPGQPGSVGPGKIALARLNPDGTPDITFGQGGQVVTDLGTSSRPANATPQSVLVQPDGNIVVTGRAAGTGPGPAFSAFAVARYVGITAPGSGMIPAGSYREDFSHDAAPPQPGFDSSGVFQHNFWYNLQPDGPSSPSDTEGSGWDLETLRANSAFALQLTGATDTITFPNLRADVHVGLASVDVTALTDAFATFVGDNGTYTAHVGVDDNETVSAGESHVLQTDQDGNPTLELGPIREIILDSRNASFDTVKILVIPGQGPLDEFVKAPPNQTTMIDVLDHATGGAAAAGLQPPLQLVSVTPPSLPGSQTAINMTGPNRIAYTNTLSAAPGRHPTDSFTYTVQDAAGKRASGTVYVTVDTPPSISITHHFSYQEYGGGLNLKHGSPGPLTGDISLSDVEGDPITLTLLEQAMHGHVTLTEISPTHYIYEYDPPTISAYNPTTGLTMTVSNIVGDDQFTVEASDGFDVTDDTVRFLVNDQPPTVANDSFVVPENTGVTYYPTNPSDPHYDITLAQPGLVHFAAPGVLWNATDPDGDPLMAVEDSGHPPQHGRLELLPDGSFIFIPDPGYTGTDTFAYFASDGYQASDPVFVTIHVAAGTPADPFENAPVLLDDYYDVDAISLGSQSLTPPIDDNDYGRGLIGAGATPQDIFWLATVRPLDLDTQGDLLFHKTASIRLTASYPGAVGFLREIDFEGLEYVHEDGSVPQAFLFGWKFEPADFQDSSIEEKAFTFTYAARNEVAGLSNFATVHFHISIPTGVNNHAVIPTLGSDAIVLDSPPGTILENAHLVSPLPSGAPPGLDFPFGLIAFDVRLLPTEADSQTTVAITLPRGVHVATYYKYYEHGYGAVPEPGTQPQRWFPFVYDPAHPQTTGAQIKHDPNTGQEVILLHLADGRFGDTDDITPAVIIDGMIVDPGGPAIFTDPARNFVASLYEDVLGRGPTDAEMAHWAQKLDRGQSRLKVARAIWDSDEHRRLQIDQWSMQLLGHPADPRQRERWVRLLRRGRGELAVEQSILTSPDYRRAHPTLDSFLAGLSHDVLNQPGDPVDPSQGRLRRHRGPVSPDKLAREVLTSPAAAAILAQQDATTFLGRPATTQETRADGLAVRRGSDAPARIAERVLASQAFYDFVNSALPTSLTSSRPDRHVHHPARQPRGR